MRLEERWIVKVMVVVGALGAMAVLLIPIGLYRFGLSVAPPRPVPEPAGAPRIFLDALWAGTDGGHATNLRPFNHLTLSNYFVCLAMASGTDAQRVHQCRHEMPGLAGLQYLATLHLQDHGMARNSFRGGHSQLATTVWMTRSWSKDDLLNTLAARGRFGFGWRGVTRAASAYFGKPPSALTLSEAAYIASRLGEPGDDPWCHPKTAVSMRNDLLSRMRDTGAISDADFRHASSVPLEFALPPENRLPCSK